MRQSLKIALSLFISVLAVSAFVLVAYSGLFKAIEATFYSPRVRQEYEQRARELHGRVVAYHEANQARFAEQIRAPYVLRAFLTTQLTQDIEARAEAFGNLRKEYQDLRIVRLVGADGRQVHFSTLPSDERERTPETRVYQPFDRIAGPDGRRLLLAEGDSARVSRSGRESAFVYSLPVVDQLGVFQGTALFYVGFRDLYSYLARFPEAPFSDFATVGDLGLVAGFPESRVSLIADDVTAAWARGGEGDVSSVRIAATSGGEAYLLFSVVDTTYGNVGLLAPESRLEMPAAVTIVLTAAFFSTLFLVVFLLLNLRQDPVTAVSERIRRFQTDFLRQFVESRRGVDWETWRRELALKEPVVRREIRRGIGRVQGSQRKEVDALVDKGWEEILNALGVRASTTGAVPTDVGRLEELVKQLMERGGAAPAASRAEPAAAAPTAAAERLGSPGPQAVELVAEAEAVPQPAGAEDAWPLDEEVLPAVEEAEPATGEAATAEAEPVEEALPVVEEALAVEAGPVADEVQPAAEAAPAAVEAAELVDVEELEPLEALEAVEEVSPAAEPVQASIAAEAAAEAAEPAEAVAEAVEVEDVEGLGPEPGAEASVAEALADEALGEVEAGLETVAAADRDALGEMDHGVSELEMTETLPEELEELEPIASFVPLPPEPFEQLEYLPPAVVMEDGEIAHAASAGADGRVLPMAAVDAIETQEIIDLVHRKEASIYAMREVLRLTPEPSEAVVEEDGIYRISQQAYSASPPEGRGELGNLATAVLGSPPAAAKAPRRRTLIAPAGLDYDDYLDQFRKPLTDRVVFRSLIAISQEISAVGVIMLAEHDGKYEPLLNIGVDDTTVSRFHFTGEDPISVDVLRKRKAFVLHKPAAAVEALRARISSEDGGYMKRAVFLPATYRGANAFLFFAFARERNLALRDLLSALNAAVSPQRTA